MSDEWAALCERCDWTAIVSSQEDSKIVAVLHAIQDHPLHYAHVTGKDPDKAAHDYQELFKKHRKDL